MHHHWPVSEFMTTRWSFLMYITINVALCMLWKSQMYLVRVLVPGEWVSVSWGSGPWWVDNILRIILYILEAPVSHKRNAYCRNLWSLWNWRLLSARLPLWSVWCSVSLCSCDACVGCGVIPTPPCKPRGVECFWHLHATPLGEGWFRHRLA